jgi:hypothetical protein
MVVIKEVENDSTREATGTLSAVRFLSTVRVHNNHGHAVSAFSSPFFPSAIQASRYWVASNARDA